MKTKLCTVYSNDLSDNLLCFAGRLAVCRNDAKEACPNAKAAALRALELGISLGEAHNSLAFALDGFDWDLDAGGKEFRRAIALNPGYATAHHCYAWHLRLLGRYDEAIAEMKKAEGLDPLSLIINADLAELFILVERPPYREHSIKTRPKHQ
jgi:tetratricopeptide (TPR) repeat protein